MSVNSLLSIARSALQTHQRAMDVTAHNVANAATPGYTRQRLDIVPLTPQRTPDGTYGRGVGDRGIISLRDQFLDQAVRRESGLAAQSGLRRDLLSGVERILGEPSDTGIASALDRFFSAFSDLANAPSSAPVRATVQQSAALLTDQVRATASRLAQADGQAREDFEAGVAEVSTIAAQVAELNTKILSQGGPNQSAPDLEDERGRLLDRLATLIDTTVIPRTDGTVGVSVGGGILLVDGGQAQQLEARTSLSGAITLAAVGGTYSAAPSGGRLGALATFVTSDLPAVTSQLDTLVAAVVGEVNTLHRTGFTPGGATGRDFFDAGGTTALTFRLDALVAGSAQEIAAGATAAAGDGGVALAIGGLRGVGLAALGGRTAGEAYTVLVGGLAGSAYAADLEAQTAEILAAGADSRRMSTTGVSTDEEMVALITHQQAFAAASRVVNVADEMMQELLRMV